MKSDQPEGITRRQAIATGVTGAAALGVLPGLVRGGGGDAAASEPREGGERKDGTPSTRQPVVFLPHGGGPWPFVDLGMQRSEVDGLASYLKSVRGLPTTPPRALLVVSAHWEEPVPTVMNGAQPPMLYDYYGFPEESYRLTWPAPGHPQLATRVQELLGKAGIATAANDKRGYDHGTFVPLKLTYPEANVPVVQLSLKHGLDPQEHLAMGRALAPLRDEGVFIVASGMTYHNMRGFRDPRSVPAAEAFDTWLHETMALTPTERDQRLTRWHEAPAARMAHPREEHLLPLMVAAGAAGASRASLAYSGTMFGMKLSAFHFA